MWRDEKRFMTAWANNRRQRDPPAKYCACCGQDGPLVAVCVLCNMRLHAHCTTPPAFLPDYAKFYYVCVECFEED
jgi:hypothetical protein